MKQTKIIQAYHGKIVETQIELHDNNYLLISTCRKHDNTIGSRASIYKRLSDNSSLLQNEDSKKFQYIDHGSVKRLTEKKLTEFHQSAIKIYNIN